MILGNKDNIEEILNSSSVVLTTVLKFIDKYNLHDQMVDPKHHKQSQVPEIYMPNAKTKVNFITLVEFFLIQVPQLIEIEHQSKKTKKTIPEIK